MSSLGQQPRSPHSSMHRLCPPTAKPQVGDTLLFLATGLEEGPLAPAVPPPPTATAAAAAAAGAGASTAAGPGSPEAAAGDGRAAADATCDAVAAAAAALEARDADGVQPAGKRGGGPTQAAVEAAWVGLAELRAGAEAAGDGLLSGALEQLDGLLRA